MSEPISEKPTEIAVLTPEVVEPAAESSTAPNTENADAVMDDAAGTEKMQKASKQSEDLINLKEGQCTYDSISP